MWISSLLLKLSNFIQIKIIYAQYMGKKADSCLSGNIRFEVTGTSSHIVNCYMYSHVSILEDNSAKQLIWSRDCYKSQNWFFISKWKYCRVWMEKIHWFGSDCGSRALAERRDLNTASVSSFALGNGVYFKPKYEFLNKIWLSWCLLDKFYSKIHTLV